MGDDSLSGMLPEMPPPLPAILETALYCPELVAAEGFYRDVLGLEFHSRAEGRHVFFRCGAGMLLLFHPAATILEDSPTRHGAVGPGHMAFRVSEAELEDWRLHLVDAEVPIDSEVHWPNGGHSLYFRDPAGNVLEVATAALWGL